MEEDTIRSGGSPEAFDTGPALEIGSEAGEDLHTDIQDIVPAPADAGEVGLDEITEAPRPWRVAEALRTLLRQVNEAVPGRSKKSDGGIGDKAHESRSSDHNPWVIDGRNGVVTAFDITHDPKAGCDAGRLAEVLRQSKDPRIKYIISNKRIASSAAIGKAPAWAWRAYAGKNPHIKHVHLSVKPDKALYDSTKKWAIDGAFKAAGILEGPVGAQAEADPLEAALAALAPELAMPDMPILPRLIALKDAADGLLAAHALESRSEEAAAGDVALETSRPRFEDLKAEYEALYASCRIPAAQAGAVAWHRNRLLLGKPRYREVEARTEVPWWVVGIIHAMEASFSFAGHLHNGDPLTARTVQVPAGRPKQWNPPSDWVSSAVDALEHDGFLGAGDWSLARTLYRWESFNGFGSRRKGINTPYLWSFSNHYSKGKYVRDGVWDPNAVSRQCGCAVMLKALEKAGDVAL